MKQILMFCRHTRGRSRIGQRAIQVLPASRGPNIHLIGAITTFGIVTMDRRRGSFRAATANEWIATVIQKWQDSGYALNDLVFVCDNAPCHSSMEAAVASNAGDLAKVLRLGPYSPILNPIEIIWSKIKTFARSQIGIPNITGPRLTEQRIAYLEDIIDRAIATITSRDCARAV